MNASEQRKQSKYNNELFGSFINANERPPESPNMGGSSYSFKQIFPYSNGSIKNYQ